jgi:hypothetical protein
VCAEMCSEPAIALVESPRSRAAAQHEPRDVDLPCGERVGGQEHAERRLRLSGLDDHRDVRVGRCAQVGGVQVEPPAGRGAHSQAGRSVGGGERGGDE